MKTKRPLTERELQALTFCRQQHAWRKKFSEPLADFMKRVPKGIKPTVWRSWYFYPCGDLRLCVDYQIVRRLLRQKVV